MAVTIVDAFRRAIEPGIRDAMDELDRLIRTPEGRQQLASEQRRMARDLRHRTLYPRHPLPAPVVADCLRYAADHDVQARKYEAMTGSKGLWEL